MYPPDTATSGDLNVTRKCFILFQEGFKESSRVTNKRWVYFGQVNTYKDVLDFQLDVILCNLTLW